MAIASGGGHWAELVRLRRAFEGCIVVYATSLRDHRSTVGADRFRLVAEGNRWQKIRLLWCAASAFWAVLRERPDVVVTTGAAPGYLAVRAAHLLRRRTVWVDSVANAEELSLSGQRAGRFADLWITQWEHLASNGGPLYFGSIVGTASLAAESSTELAPGVDRTVGVSGAEDRGDLRKKIFVTVGTELPFDRMIRAIDQWAGKRSSDLDVFAQIGHTDYRPAHIEWVDFVNGEEFAGRFDEADLVIGHAGTGTILRALQLGQPLLVMPRKASLGEHRNEHQLATAERFGALGFVDVVDDEQELIEHLDALKAAPPLYRIGPDADASLVRAIRCFIQG